MSTTTLAAGGVAVVAAGAALAVALWLRREISAHAFGSTAYAIEQEIRQTQVPARALGIRVLSIDDDSLSLTAPLHRNRNVHGTAFAGSLYSIGVLCAYYLGVEWMRREGLAGAYTIVAKGGHISYKKPVKSAHIVARSVLPDRLILADFRRMLQAEGKAVVDVCGTVMIDDKVHVEYTIEVCAFKPRRD